MKITLSMALFGLRRFTLNIRASNAGAVIGELGGFLNDESDLMKMNLVKDGNCPIPFLKRSRNSA